MGVPYQFKGGQVIGSTNFGSQLDADFAVLRVPLTAPTTFNVTTSTISTTLANIFNKVDFGGQTVTVQLAAGTYTTGITLLAWTGGGSLVFNGDAGTPSNVFINVSSGNCFSNSATLPGPVLIQNLELSAPNGSGIDNESVGTFQINNIVCAACGTAFAMAAGGAILRVVGPYSIIAGTNVMHYRAARGGLIDMNGQQVTMTGVIGYTTFAMASNGGMILRNNAPAINISGATVSGQTYNAVTNGIINSNGGGANYFPGNVAGTISTQGQYI